MVSLKAAFISFLLIKLAYSMNYSQEGNRRLRRVSQIYLETPVVDTDRILSTIRDDGIDEEGELHFRHVKNQDATRNLSLWSSFMNMLHPHDNCHHRNHGDCNGNGNGNGTDDDDTPSENLSPSPTVSSTLSPTAYEDYVSNDMYCWWCNRSERSGMSAASYASIGIITIGSAILALSIIRKRRRTSVVTREHLLDSPVQTRRSLFASLFSSAEKIEVQASK